MRKVIRGYAKEKNLNLILIGTIPVPQSKDKRSPAARQDKRYSVRQGATTFKKERFVSCPLQIEWMTAFWAVLAERSLYKKPIRGRTPLEHCVGRVGYDVQSLYG